MPLYVYRCENCGVQFDQRQQFTDPPLVTCPECGDDALRKLYQPVGIVFKGSGFYATDHRSPSGKSSSAKKSDSANGSEPSPAKSESAPAKADDAPKA
jgi:putative FmdB family regulatory protein